VEVLALRIAKPDPDDKYGRSLAPGMQAGTQISCRVAVKGKHVIRIDDRAGTLTRLADDTGKALAKPGVSSFRNRWLRTNRLYGKKDGYAHFQLAAKKVPASGATKIQAQAKVVLITGAEEKTIELKDVALEAGEAIRIGTVPASISKIRADGYGKTKLTITLKNDVGFDALKTISFLDAAGKEIKHRSAGSGQFGYSKKYTYTRDFGLEQKVDKVTIKATYFSKLERVTIPVDLSVGAGL